MSAHEPNDEHTPTPTKSNLGRNLLILTAIVAIGGVAAVRTFGPTIEGKFSKADSGVEDNVNFTVGGGGGDYAPAPAHDSPGVFDNMFGGSEEPAAKAEAEIAPAPAPIGQSRAMKAPAVPEPEPQAIAPTDATSARAAVNPMTSTAIDRFSTFAADVDTGSYTRARSHIKSNSLPFANEVRVEEFVNYFQYNYPAPNEGAFAVDIEAAPSPFDASGVKQLVRIGVQGKQIAPADRKPVHLTFLVDVSGSMSNYNKLPLAKQAMEVLVDQLDERDSISLVTYAGATRVILEPTAATKKARIMRAVESLGTAGGTAMGDGMKLAYEQAAKKARPGHVSRVIVLSDGDANIGRVSHSEILETIETHIDDGITMSTIGFGMGNYNDKMMEQLANKGNGNYYYIDSLPEAKRIFGEQATGTLEVIARDVKLQVEFNPKAIASYRLVGYENRDIADEDFRNDSVDAGEIGAGHTVTALYEVVPTGVDVDLMARVKVRYADPEDAKVTELGFEMTRANVRGQLSDASPDFQFASAVATFAELLRDSPYTRHLSLDLVVEVARGASSSNQTDRQEFIGLVEAAKRLRMASAGF